jgi:hypothetical protein
MLKLQPVAEEKSIMTEFEPIKSPGVSANLHQFLQPPEISPNLLEWEPIKILFLPVEALEALGEASVDGDSQTD